MHNSAEDLLSVFFALAAENRNGVHTLYVCATSHRIGLMVRGRSSPCSQKKKHQLNTEMNKSIMILSSLLPVATP